MVCHLIHFKDDVTTSITRNLEVFQRKVWNKNSMRDSNPLPSETETVAQLTMCIGHISEVLLSQFLKVGGSNPSYVKIF